MSNKEIQITNLTTNICLNGKHGAHIGSQAEFEVNCAFFFLFESNTRIKELIVKNFEYEEKIALLGSYKQENSKLDTRNVHGCSHDRSDRSDIHDGACQLTKVIKDGKCKVSEEQYDIECFRRYLKMFIPGKYQNKFNMTLTTGGPHALLYALRSFCNGQSAFITFSIIDVGVYLHNRYFHTQQVKPDCNHQPKNPTTFGSNTKSTYISTTPVNEFKIKSESSFTRKVTTPAAKTPQNVLANSAKQQFIIESIVGYFLRAIEQRLNCNVDFSA